MKSTISINILEVIVKLINQGLLRSNIKNYLAIVFPYQAHEMFDAVYQSTIFKLPLSLATYKRGSSS